MNYHEKDFRKISRFLKVCLDIAEWVDEKRESTEKWYGGEMCDAIGLGCGTLSSYLREGVRQVISLQERYHNTTERLGFAEMETKDQRSYLIDIFGDEEPYTFNDEDKEKIKTFVNSLMEDYESED